MNNLVLGIIIGVAGLILVGFIIAKIADYVEDRYYKKYKKPYGD